MNKFTFFWGGPFSNWATSTFKYKDITFSCSEQAMMWEKAMTFGDTATASQILETSDPSAQKKLGRLVNGYDDKVWSLIREELVFDICKAKFTQSAKMREELLNTGNTLLVEASPYDKIWGIGLGVEDPRSLDEAQWQGLNLLGQVLTNVREEIKNEQN